MCKSLSMFAFAFLLAAVSACDQIVAPNADHPAAKIQADRSATSERTITEIAFSVPLFLDCLNEEVVWSGTVQYRDQIVTRPDGSVRINEHAALLPGSTLTGPSGTWINPRVSSHVNLSCSALELCFLVLDDNLIVNERIRWENSESGESMDVSVQIKLIRAGNGDWKLEVFSGHTCSMRG